MTMGKVETRLTYLAPGVESSLYRNGRVFTRRDSGGSDQAFHGAVTLEREVAIHDARRAQSSAPLTLAEHGFELHDRPLEVLGMDFFDHRQVVETYYPQCAAIVRQATGAALVRAFDHNLRWAPGKDSGKQVAGGQQVQAPIQFVHGDYTLTSAPQRLRDLAGPPGGNDTLRAVLAAGQTLLSEDEVAGALSDGGRFALINVWRSIGHEPVARDPLALCNGRSVEAEDLVVFEIHYADRIGENYFAKHAPRHQWWYYPGMTRDEALLIKQWDAAGTLARTNGARSDASAEGVGTPCTFSFHSAFSDPATPPDAPHRQSIEVRCVALFR